MSGDAVAFIIGVVAFFSYLAVASWADARRKEREAYYKSEAIKKLAEMQGPIPDSVLQLVRETLGQEWKFSSPVWAPSEYRRDREAYYRTEMLRRIAAMPGATLESAMEFLRNEERTANERRRDGIRLGGMITTAAGIGILIAVRALIPDMPFYLVGLLPVLLGIVLLVFSEMLRARGGSQQR